MRAMGWSWALATKPWSSTVSTLASQLAIPRGAGLLGARLGPTPRGTAWSRSRTSAQLWGRRAGSRAIIANVSSASSGVREGTSVRGSGRSSVRCLRAMARGVGAEKGTRPVSASKSVMPRE